MPSRSNTLEIIINGTNNMSGTLNKAAQQVVRFGAVASAAFAGAAVRAGQFERGVAEIGTLLDGDVRGQMEAMRGELLDMSVQFGQTMGNMTKARYDIVSAGFTDAADSAMVLEAASKLAIAGVSDVASTADLLTTALNGMGLSASDAEAVGDVLFQTVRKGKTTMNDLAASMGPLFATAKTAGIGLEELAGFMATTTAKGINTRESVTALNNMMLALAAPTGAAKKKLQELGITLDNGIGPAMTALATVSEDGLDALTELIPNIRALKAAATAAQDVETLEENTQAMADAAGVMNDGVDLMGETFDFKTKQMRSAMDALVIEIGTQVLPVFTEMVTRATLVAKWIRDNRDAMWELGNQIVPVVSKIVKIALALIGLQRVMMALRMASVLLNRSFLKVTLVIGGLLAGIAGIRKLFPDLMKDFDLVEMAMSGVNGAIEELIAKQPHLAGLFAALKGEAEDARAAADDAEDAIRNLGGGGEGGEGVGLFDTGAGDQVNFMKELSEQTKITAQDISNAAFALSGTLGNAIVNVGTSLIGLSSGAYSFGDAMKSVLSSVLQMVAQLIARLIAAKVLMAAFGGGFLSGFLPIPMASGGKVPTAARGYTVPGGRGPLGMATGMVLPGMPGTDRTLVAATGGEVFTPRAEANFAERMLMKTLTSPRRTSGGRGGVNSRAKRAIEFKIDRPFRREEQLNLRDSVIDAEDRAGKYRV